MKRAAPSLDAKHFIDVDEPEECVLLLTSSFRAPTSWMFTPVYGYLEWYMKQDLRPAYKIYREHLQLFQAETPDQRLTLKAPWHTPHIQALLTEIPDAMIVHTHRDPVPVVNSHASLAYTVHSVFSEQVDVKRMGRANLELMAWMIHENMRQRSEIDSSRILDLRYEALVKDPVGAVQRIYEYFGLDFQTEFEERLRSFLSNRPKDKFGCHDYSAEDFGLTDEGVREPFVDYVGQFLE